jgi:drug/metabolite transporter (DMT)-like permease
MLLPFVLYALFASVFTISKTGLAHAEPYFFVGYRMILAGVLLLAYQFFFRRERFTLNRCDFWKIIQLAVFCVYLTNVFEFWGLQYLTSFKTCFIYSLSPFLSALISYFTLSEKMSPKKWIGLFMGFAGLMPMVLSQTTAEERAGQLFFFSWAELSIIAAVICSVYGWILLKQLVRDRGYSPIMANGLGMVIGGIFALAHSYTVENWDPFPVSGYLPFLTCTLLLIIISNFIAYNLYGYLLKKFSATFMSFAGLSTPIFTALFGWLFLNEQPSWEFYISLSIVSFGLYAFYQEELKPVIA